MSEKSLREMATEIKERIELGRPNEAISMTQALLRHVPRYLLGYRLLAEAALEQGNTRDAIEIFRRVLSVDPENHVAYAGVASAFTEEGDLDEALWHMLRSFELRPDMREIRTQLRYLYEQHDGRAPGRLPLNAAALARSYVTTGRYTLAVPELEALINDDPDRVDLRLALAEAQWRVGRRDLASRYARQVLLELPYSLKANLLMGQLFAELGEQEAAIVHFDITQALDPENEMAQALFGDESALKPTRVILDTEGARGDLAAFDATQTAVPDWLSDLSLFTEVSDAQEADWDAIVAYESDWRTQLGRVTHEALAAFQPDWRVNLLHATRRGVRQWIGPDGAAAPVVLAPTEPVAFADDGAAVAFAEDVALAEPTKGGAIIADLAEPLDDHEPSVPTEAADFWLVEPESKAAERWDAFATEYKATRSQPLPPLWRVSLLDATRDALAARESAGADGEVGDEGQPFASDEVAAVLTGVEMLAAPEAFAEPEIAEEAIAGIQSFEPEREWVSNLHSASLAALDAPVGASFLGESEDAAWQSDTLNPALRHALDEAERLDRATSGFDGWAADALVADGFDAEGAAWDETAPETALADEGSEWTTTLRDETSLALVDADEVPAADEADDLWAAALVAEELSLQEPPTDTYVDLDLPPLDDSLDESGEPFDSSAIATWDEALAAEVTAAEGDEMGLLVSEPMDALDSDLGPSPTWHDVLRANTDLALALNDEAPSDYHSIAVEPTDAEGEAVAEELTATPEQGIIEDEAIAVADGLDAAPPTEAVVAFTSDDADNADSASRPSLLDAAQSVTSGILRKATDKLGRFADARLGASDAPTWHSSLRSATADELDEPSSRGILGRLRDAAGNVASSAVSRVQEGAEAVRDRVSEIRSDASSDEDSETEAQAESTVAADALVAEDASEPMPAAIGDVGELVADESESDEPPAVVESVAVADEAVADELSASDDEGAESVAVADEAMADELSASDDEGAASLTAEVEVGDEAVEREEAPDHFRPAQTGLLTLGDPVLEARRLWKVGDTRDAVLMYQEMVMLEEVPANLLAVELEAWIATEEAPALSYQMLGDLYRRLGRTREALAMYREAVTRM